MVFSASRLRLLVPRVGEARAVARGGLVSCRRLASSEEVHVRAARDLRGPTGACRSPTVSPGVGQRRRLGQSRLRHRRSPPLPGSVADFWRRLSDCRFDSCDFAPPPHGRRLRPWLFVVTGRRRLAVTCATGRLVVSPRRPGSSIVAHLAAGSDGELMREGRAGHRDPTQWNPVSCPVHEEQRPRGMLDKPEGSLAQPNGRVKAACTLLLSTQLSRC